MATADRTDPGDMFHKLMGCNLATVSLAISVLAGLIAMAAGFGSRAGLWHFRTGFTVLHWGAGIAAVALPAAAASLLLSVRKRLWRCAVVSIVGFLVGMTVFIVPVKWRRIAAAAPRIHDVTTDLVQPPSFVAILPLRQGAPNPAYHGGNVVALQQQAAYPDIKTVLLDMPADQVFRLALETAQRLGWDIVATAPEEGRIEATDTTFWFGFTDDIVIRVTPAGHRSLVDIRSVSRVGRSDAGTNAARVRRFTAALTPRE